MPRAAAKKVEEKEEVKVEVEEKEDTTDMFVSQIKQRVVAGGGAHIMRFEARVPRKVAKAIQHEMINFGILPVDGEPPIRSQDPQVEKPAPNGKERIDLIDDAIQQLVDRNVATDFSAGGLPKVAAIQKKLDFEISERERDERWKANRLAAAEARQA